MTPDDYIQLSQAAADLKTQLDTASDGDKPPLRAQLAANVLVLRVTLIHEHLEACAAPHAKCKWNNVQYPFDPMVEESWIPANKVAMLADMNAKVQSGTVQPIIPGIAVPPPPKEGS